MADFILLMHGDGVEAISPADWETYVSGLSKAGVMQGGSAMGGGLTARKNGDPAPLTAVIEGYIRVKADDLEHARTLLAGNPVYEAGGTVEIRELPVTG